MLARLQAALFAALLFLLPGGARAADSAPTDPERQILVMIHLAPPHFRSGSSYGGGYGEDQSRAGRQRVAERIAKRHGLRLAGNWPMPLIGIDCFIMEVPGGRATDAVAVEVSRDPGVDWSEPVAMYKALGAPQDNDPLLAAQPATHFWQLETLHKVATGRGARVAVIDSQVEAAHPDLIGQVAVARDFVTGHPSVAEDHGTGIAGVIAARAGNGLGIAGIAPRARLLALRACWQQPKGATSPTVCDSLSLAKAVAFAVEQRADIINMSLSGPPNRLLAALLRSGMDKGATIVAAYDRGLPEGGFPASLPGVLAIASEPVGGPGGPYSAPGRDIPTTQPGGRWYLVNGASYAAAEVSGLLALLRERRATGGALRALVSARQGGGEIDACATLVGNAKACARPAAARAAPAKRTR
jgi:subtilisin family serine protease